MFVAFSRLLLTGVKPSPAVVDSFFENREIIEVLAGNLFDGDMGYNMVGFRDHITVNIFFSHREEPWFTHHSPRSRCTFTVRTKPSILAK